MMKVSPIHEIAKQLNAERIELAGWKVVRNFGEVEVETAVLTTHVALSDQSHNGKIRIEGQTAGKMLDADKLAINAGKPFEDGWVYRLRRDLFFISMAGDGGETAVTLTHQANDSPDLITVTDVTHGNSELWLIGPHSAELLSRLCGLDFHDSQFPDGIAKQTSVAKTTQLIIRRDLGAAPAYVLIGGRSLAVYLWQTILEAGQDLGIQPVGTAVVKALI